jgi:hypothetical protein
MRALPLKAFLFLCIVPKCCEGISYRVGLPSRLRNIRRSVHLGRQAIPIQSFSTTSFVPDKFAAPNQETSGRWPFDENGSQFDSTHNFDEVVIEPTQVSVVDKYCRSYPEKLAVTISASLWGSIAGGVISAVSVKLLKLMGFYNTYVCTCFV